eukprot:gene30364-37567_t
MPSAFSKFYALQDVGVDKAFGIVFPVRLALRVLMTGGVNNSDTSTIQQDVSMWGRLRSLRAQITHRMSNDSDDTDLDMSDVELGTSSTHSTSSRHSATTGRSGGESKMDISSHSTRSNSGHSSQHISRAPSTSSLRNLNVDLQNIQ